MESGQTAANQALCRELLDNWYATSARIVPLKVSHVAQLAIVVGLAAHTHELANATLALQDAEHDLASIPLIRQALECSVTAIWTALLPDAWAGLLNADARSQKLLGKELLEASIDVPRDEINEAMALYEDDLVTTTTGSASKFQQRCQDLEGGPDLYPVYRALSNASHAGIRVVDPYIAATGDGPTVFRKIPVSTRGAEGLSVLASALVIAGIAEDTLNRNHPRRRFLRSAAARHGISHQFDLSPIAKKRLAPVSA